MKENIWELDYIDQEELYYLKECGSYEDGVLSEYFFETRKEAWGFIKQHRDVYDNFTTTLDFKI